MCGHMLFLCVATKNVFCDNLSIMKILKFVKSTHIVSMWSDTDNIIVLITTPNQPQIVPSTATQSGLKSNPFNFDI